MVLEAQIQQTQTLEISSTTQVLLPISGRGRGGGGRGHTNIMQFISVSEMIICEIFIGE